MGSRALGLSPADSTAAALLEETRREQGVPKDVLAERCGVRPTRLRTILSQSRPMTLGELDAIAEALGMVGWKVLRQAEEGGSLASSHPVSPAPDPGTSGTGVATVVPFPERHPRHNPEPALPPLDRLAARTVTHRPQHDAMHAADHAGEEDQTPNNK